MSVESMSKALKLTGLTRSQKLCLVGIANHDGDGGAWPSIATLAQYLDASERTAQRTVAELETLGWIVVHKNAGGNVHTRSDRRPNLYVIQWGNGVTNPRGDKPGIHGVTNQVERGDIAVSPEPSVTIPEPSTAHAEVAEAFERFWKSWPQVRRREKPKAKAAFAKTLKRNDCDLALLRRAFKAYQAHWATNEARDCPYPAKWLREHYWLEESWPTGTHAAPREQTNTRPEWNDMTDKQQQMWAGIPGVDPNA